MCKRRCGSSSDTGCKNCPCSGKKVVAAKSVRKCVRHAAAFSAGESNERDDRRHYCVSFLGGDAPCICIGHRFQDLPETLKLSEERKVHGQEPAL